MHVFRGGGLTHSQTGNEGLVEGCNVTQLSQGFIGSGGICDVAFTVVVNGAAFSVGNVSFNVGGGSAFGVGDVSSFNVFYGSGRGGV